MKITNEQFMCQLELKENMANVLVIEKPDQFARIINELREQILGNNFGWILSENGKELPFGSNIELIIDPFSTELNQKRILTKLYSVMEKNVIESELINRWRTLYSEMYNMAISVMDEMPYSLECSEDGSIVDLFKELDVKFDSNPENLLEKLIDYICVINNVYGKQIFIFVNIKSYLTNEELNLLYKKMFYEKIFVLLIENKDSDDIIECESVIVIDKDMCVIQKN